jgi:hypothetical protein
VVLRALVYVRTFYNGVVLRALVQIEMCVKEIDLWMVKNKLKLNGDKTELLL